MGNSVRVYEAPALPVGSRFRGIAHLHGSVDGAPEDLVLTDADYGRAYLTESWARRFLVDLFLAERLFVLFVGYSADDPPMQYLTRALPVEGKERRFAFTDTGNISHWEYLGINALPYSLAPAGANRHIVLLEAVREWAANAHLGALGHEARIRDLVSQPPKSLSIEDESYLLQSLEDGVRRRFFVLLAGHEWLGWARDHNLLPLLRRDDDVTDDSMRDLSRWAAKHICSTPQFLLEFLGRARDVILHPLFWRDILSQLTVSTPSAPRHECAALIAILIESAPSGDHRGEWARLLDHIDADECPELALLLLDEILRPRFQVDPFGGRHAIDLGRHDGTGHVSSATSAARMAKLQGHPGWLAMLERHLRRTYYTLKSSQVDSGHRRVLSHMRSAIEPHHQNFEWGALNPLIDAIRDALTALRASHPRFVSSLLERWSSDPDDLVFVRLAINGVREDPRMSGDEKIRWAVDRKFIHEFGLKHEVFQLLASAYPGASPGVRSLLLDAVRDLVADPGADEELKEVNVYEVYNAYVWLKQADPQCDLVAQRLEQEQREHPAFGPREYPDLDSWVGPVTNGWRSAPVDWLRMEPEAAAQHPSLWEDATSLAQAVKQDSAWAWRLVDVLERAGAWDRTPWGGVLAGWSKTHPDDVEAWTRVLAYLKAHVEQLHLHTRGVADLLLESVRSEPRTLPSQCRDAAVSLAADVLKVAVLRQEPSGVGDDQDVVTQAINHPAGIIAEFLVHVAEVRVQGEQQEEAGEKRTLAPDIAIVAADAAAAPPPCGQFATAVLCSQLPYLFSLDSRWARATLLPLFDWDADRARAAAAWHGFLTWGRWTRELLPELLPSYLKTCDHLADLPARHREAFAGHVAGIYVYGERDELLTRLIRSGGKEDRTALARSLGHVVSGLDGEKRSSIWGARIDPYWSLRQQGIPRPFDPEEVQAMMAWLPNLGPLFPLAVGRIRQQPAHAVEMHGLLFYRLVEGNVAEEYPDAVGHLLEHVLPMARQPFYECQHVEQMVRTLRRQGWTPERLRAICESFTALGCDSGELWREVNGTAEAG